MLLLLCGFLNLVVMGDKLWTVLGPTVQKERKMGVLHQYTTLLKDKIAINDMLHSI